ncbi:MAG: FAD-dependent oxidoreductase [Patescibacteria group bacterium]
MNPVSFTAGEYAHVRLLNLSEDIRRVREFSFASSPQESEVWFAVDGRSKSEYQQALRSLAPGDEIEIFKIKGHMTWPPPSRDVVMIANGVGAAPFRSMLLDKVERNLSLTTTLISVARESFLYMDEFRNLAGTYLPIRRDQLAETLEEITDEHPGAHYCVAGSSDFVLDVVQTLSDKGIVRVESDEFKGLLRE